MKYQLILAFIIIVSIITYLNVSKLEGFRVNNMIDKVYVINLDDSKDRLQYMEEQCDKCDLQFERFPAINGKKLNKELLRKQGLLATDKMMIGAIGCSLSHINIWKKVLNNTNYQNILVLEDDCIIDPNFWNKFNSYKSQIPKNFDILYLGGSNIYGKKISKNILKPKFYSKNSTHNTGMYAMLINRKVLQKLIDSNTPIDDNIDQVLKNKLFNKINTYYVFPPLIKHNNEFDSMRRINSNRAPTTNWFKNIQDNINIV